MFKPEGEVIGTSKSITTVRSHVCRRIFSSFLVLLFGCPAGNAKATVLTMVDMDTGYVGVLMVSGKSPSNSMVRSTSSFVGRRNEAAYNGEPAVGQLAEKIATFHIRVTSCHTSAEDGHSCENRGGPCAWTYTFPVDAETHSVGAQSIPASKS